MKYVRLSYDLGEDTPTYGDRDRVEIYKTSSMEKGDPANNTWIHTTTHAGTHLDMPCHFYDTDFGIEHFTPETWFVTNPLLVELQPRSYVIYEELIEQLEGVEDNSVDMLIVKTGACENRDDKSYVLQNYGFAPELAELLRRRFPRLKMLGFDSVSVSSFTDRMLGRKAHKAFLDPRHPVLLLEDMDLRCVDKQSRISQIVVAPLYIKGSDGIPCTVFAEVSRRQEP